MNTKRYETLEHAVKDYNLYATQVRHLRKVYAVAKDKAVNGDRFALRYMRKVSQKIHPVVVKRENAKMYVTLLGRGRIVIRA